MEVFLLYLDELDDLYWAVAAQRERILRTLVILLQLAVTLVIAALGALAAILQPGVALVLAGVLALSLLFAPALRETSSRA